MGGSGGERIRGSEIKGKRTITDEGGRKGGEAEGKEEKRER